MTIKLIFFINLLISITLIYSKSPLKSNLIILFQTILISIIINLINKTSWISFIIFILYVRGLIIIFLYISRIAFNELNINKNFKLLILLTILILLIILKFKSLFIKENFNFENKYIFEDNKYFINIFIIPNNLIIYFIILILFFILILVIWLLKNKKGPLRQKI